MSLSLEDVHAAARRLGNRIHRTPVIACQSFDDACGYQVSCQCILDTTWIWWCGVEC